MGGCTQLLDFGDPIPPDAMVDAAPIVETAPVIDAGMLQTHRLPVQSAAIVPKHVP